MAVSEKVRHLVESYSDLSAEERHEFVSLVAPTDETEISAEWRTELYQRAKAIDDGTVELIEGEDFLRQLRAM
jgi:uncharacterized membrane protein YgcG